MKILMKMTAVAVLGILFLTGCGAEKAKKDRIAKSVAEARVKANQANSKADLKNIGIAVTDYFADGSENTFPGSFSDYKISQRINLSKYVYLAKKGESYRGDATIGLACEKPDPSKNTLFVVYEDGYVGSIKGSFSTIEEVKTALKKK